MIDLAQRGILRIDEETPLAVHYQFRVHKQPSVEPVAPHENTLLSIGFAGSEVVALEDFQRRVKLSAGTFSQAVDDELITAGLMYPKRSFAQGRRNVAGIALVGIALLAGIIAAVVSSRSLPLAGAMMIAALCTGFAGVVVFVLALGVSPLTAAGGVAATEWKDFGTQSMRPSEWLPLLPYAVAYRNAAPLIQAAQSEGAFKLPGWFEPSRHPRATEAFAAFIQAVDGGGEPK